MSSRSLYLNTSDSLRPQSPHDTSFSISSLDLASIAQYKLIVKSVIMANARTPVHQYNCNISWTEDDSLTDFDLTIQLTHQSFTGAQLATAVAAAMTTESAANGHGFTYSGAYNAQTRKLTITLTD